MNLQKLGWHTYQQHCQKQELFIQFESKSVARVMAQHKDLYTVCYQDQIVCARLSGRLFHELQGDFPVVGDWVNVREQDDTFIVTDILPRCSKFSRRACGSKVKEQVIAANLDTVFVVMGLDQDLNLRRLERFLTLIWEGGCNVAIILNKCDTCAESEATAKEIEISNPGIPVFITSTITLQGIPELSVAIYEGLTVTFVGSSGVGKSSLVNALMEKDVQKVQEVRQFKDRGKHTTTNREMFPLPHGGLLIDTPGIREVQLWSTTDSVDQSFRDIEALSQNCFFRNCTHQSEPECAIQKALEDGDLDGKRLQNYLKMRREVVYFEEKTDGKAQQEKRRKQRKFSKMVRKKMKSRQQRYL